MYFKYKETKKQNTISLTQESKQKMDLWKKLDKSPQKSMFKKLASVNFLNFFLQNIVHNSLILAKHQNNFLHSKYLH